MPLHYYLHYLNHCSVFHRLRINKDYTEYGLQHRNKEQYRYTHMVPNSQAPLLQLLPWKSSKERHQWDGRMEIVGIQTMIPSVSQLIDSLVVGSHFILILCNFCLTGRATHFSDVGFDENLYLLLSNPILKPLA